MVEEKRNLSSLGIKYPTHRDNPLHTGDIWLLGKRKDDKTDNLWRVHDGLYDFTGFIKNHPGGSEWLTWTKGTDITEAFESHHIRTAASDILPKYFVRKATTPRNSPFTFKENEFYSTLKKEIREELPKIPPQAINRSKIIADLLLLGYLFLSIVASVRMSYFYGALAGVFLALLTIAAHNFFHQRNNFRMYYFNFSFMSWRQWRITHALSHHLYTNTINDIEITALEPFLQYLPTPKSWIYKLFCWLISPIVYAFIFIGTHLRVVIQNFLWNTHFHWDDFIPYTALLLMYLVSGRKFVDVLLMFVFIIIVASIHFGFVGVNAAHHHPDIFHDGDKPRPKEEMDWGIYQLDAVMDRVDITGSLFLVLTNFGDHGLHHLFPTIDHAKLEYLYPIFEKTCIKFGVELRMTNQLELVKGQFRQLLKSKPKENAPRPLLVKAVQ